MCTSSVMMNFSQSCRTCNLSCDQRPYSKLQKTALSAKGNPHVRLREFQKLANLNQKLLDRPVPVIYGCLGTKCTEARNSDNNSLHNQWHSTSTPFSESLNLICNYSQNKIKSFPKMFVAFPFTSVIKAVIRQKPFPTP